MKQLFNYILSILLVGCLILILPAKNACAADIRKAVATGRFYPASRSELEQTIDSLTFQAKQTSIQIPPDKQLKALILPHAGYVCSGLTAAHASLVLRKNQFNRVILMGPDHKVGFNNCAITNADAYETPLGLVRLNDDAAKLRANSDLFQSIPASDRVEHSLEVILPFLQRYLNGFEVIPVVMGRGNVNQIERALNPLLDQNTLIVVSSDLSHYLPYSQAVKRDRETINMILNMESDKLLKNSNRACGIIPILIVLEMAGKHGWKPLLLHYSNSGDTVGGRSQVVGYAAIAFYGDSSMQKKHNQQQIDPQLGQALVKLARQTIMQRLGLKISDKESDLVATTVKDEALKARRGTFVTLKIAGHLRGCIGSLAAEESIVDGVKRNAVNAAFHDPRFSPLTVEEIEDVDIEISILTKPQPLEYIDSVDLISKLRVNVDGVILRKGRAGATFLPQVWEQLPRPENFLSHLCVKAGLSANAWRKTGLEVKTYQVQYFEEKK
ncbi:MAG: AmmeMemoRadiSam system protein B [Desulfobacteraceae bacterium]|nr:AmmeMemoRadiSam system protein B [Pseudomonadota bacterium]MCG2754609.1 AmmeMemoRadiSam system protein B [Desulfobacteraceae bacterium]